MARHTRKVKMERKLGEPQPKHFGKMKFKEVPPPKDRPGSRAFYSPEGLSPEEMEEFAKAMHGPNAEVLKVAGDHKYKSAGEMAKAVHKAGKRVVGAQSGRDLSVEDLKQIIQRQGLFRKEPHLIDLILDGGLFNPEMAPPLSTLHQAKKFIFDAGASEYIGALLLKAQAEVLSQHDWARPPFETTWVEIDHAAYWERGLGASNDMRKGAPDNLFGFLVHKGTVSLFSYAPGGYGGAKGKPCGCGPFQYQLHTPVTVEEEMAMAHRHGFTLSQYRQALLGGMVDAESGRPLIDDAWWDTVGGGVVRAHKMFVNPLIKGSMDRASPQERAQALASGAGDLKLVLALLLMITRPRKAFTVVEAGPKRMLYKGHNLVRRAHSVVTMRLTKEKALRHATKHEFTSVHRQMHDVRGHWAETRHGPLCQEHSWEPIDKDHFYCLHCPAKRWWKKAHTRGELRLGDKTTDYEVKR